MDHGERLALRAKLQRLAGIPLKYLDLTSDNELRNAVNDYETAARNRRMQ